MKLSTIDHSLLYSLISLNVASIIVDNFLHAAAEPGAGVDEALCGIIGPILDDDSFQKESTFGWGVALVFLSTAPHQ